MPDKCPEGKVWNRRKGVCSYIEGLVKDAELTMPESLFWKYLAATELPCARYDERRAELRAVRRMEEKKVLEPLRAAVDMLERMGWDLVKKGKQRTPKEDDELFGIDEYLLPFARRKLEENSDFIKRRYDEAIKPLRKECQRAQLKTLLEMGIIDVVLPEGWDG